MKIINEKRKKEAMKKREEINLSIVCEEMLKAKGQAENGMRV